jgi:RND family efflux transporter MFP subunit
MKRSPKQLFHLFLIGTGLALLPGAAGCSHKAAADSEQTTRVATLTVTVARPTRQSLHRVIEQPGYVEAFEETPIYVKVSGYVKRLLVDIGDSVREGDLLAELSVPELEAELKEKVALIEQAKAEVVQANEAVKAGEASLATAEARIKEMEAGRTRARANCERFQKEYTRIQGLVLQKVMDQQVRDETFNQYQAAQSACEEVEAKVQSAVATRNESAAKLAKLRADVLAAQARLRVAHAEQQRVAALFDYTHIRAPFNGRITDRPQKRSTGHFLQPPDGGEKAAPLFVIVRADTVRIFVDVPEADAVRVKKDAPVQVRIQGLQGVELQGKVTRFSWALHRLERTLRTEIDLPNADGKLRPGMYAQARIGVEHPETWTVPAAAVVNFDAQDHCFLMENGKAVRLPLKIGARQGDRVEVLKKQRTSAQGSLWEDLKGDEEIITSNPRALADGQAVSK